MAGERYRGEETDRRCCQGIRGGVVYERSCRKMDAEDGRQKGRMGRGSGERAKRLRRE